LPVSEFWNFSVITWSWPVSKAQLIFFVKTQRQTMCKMRKKIRTNRSWVPISRILVWPNFRTAGLELTFFRIWSWTFSDFFSKV
jgi:hypothetical protein